MGPRPQLPECGQQLVASACTDVADGVQRILQKGPAATIAYPIDQDALTKMH